jgi:hypothetical protein
LIVSSAGLHYFAQSNPQASVKVVNALADRLRRWATGAYSLLGQFGGQPPPAQTLSAHGGRSLMTESV